MGGEKMPVNIRLLNFIIIIFLSITFFWNLHIWMEKDEKIENRNGEVPTEEKGFNAFNNTLLSKDEYASIEEKNLFHPYRKTSFLSSDTVINEENEENNNKIIDIYPALYGTLILGDRKLAILKFPDKENKKKTYTIGDAVGGSKLSEILPDRVVLEGNKRKIILLNDPNRPKEKKIIGKTPLTKKEEIKATKKVEIPDVFKTSKDVDSKIDEKTKEEIMKNIEKVRKLTPF
ncbi:MAG: hypothetical protein SV062_07510 [Thermodesulfobacteriota bacterium]|nr:hypothetical protein [Thermodesulfobacteriota bacterium]